MIAHARVSPGPNEPVVFLPRDRFVGWLLDDAIDPARTSSLLADLQARGFDRTGDRYPAGYRDNDRLVFDDAALARELFELLRDRLPPVLDAHGLPLASSDGTQGERWELCGLNVRFRACRYTGGQSFCIHRDGPFTPSDDVRSFLTVQLYLDDDASRAGGHTRFYADVHGQMPWASIAPRAGAAIVFDHRAWHDGEPVTAGVKHVLRTDAVYRRVSATAHVGGLPPHDVIGQHRGYAWQAIVLRDGSIASAGRDGTVRRWKHDLEPTHGLDGAARSVDLRHGSITTLVEDADGRIWCGARSGEIFVLELESFADRRLQDLDRERMNVTEPVTRVATGLAAITNAACNGDTIAFTTSRGEILAFGPCELGAAPRERHAWTNDAAPRWTAQAHDGWAWSIVAHRDGFLSCGHDGRVMRIDRDGRARVWADIGRPVRAIASAMVPRARMAALDTVAVIGDERGWLHWLARDGSAVRSQRAHAATVTSIAIGDGYVVSASEDGTVKRWPRGDVLAELRDFVTSVVIDRDDLIVAGYDGAIRRITPTS